MNKIKPIYATQISEYDDPIPIKTTFDQFRNKLDSKIKDTITLKKKLISKQVNQYSDQLSMIKEQAIKCKKKIYQQQMEFEEKIENYIKYDINKWNDYQNYFKDNFTELQQSIQNHKNKNRQHLNKIGMKKVQLKEIMQEEKRSHVRVSSLLKRAEQKSSNKTTKQSSVQLSYSPSSPSNPLKRIKTQSSLPVLQPSNRFGRIKTIQSQSDIQEYVLNQRKPKRVMSYMEPIGTLREKQQSSFPLLIELLKWYKQKQENNIGDNWFLKILFHKRNFNKLIDFMSNNSLQRKIQKKL